MKSLLNHGICILFVSLIAITPITTQAKESARKRDARMKWWREARFGMFVHWGLYSGLGGVWKGKNQRLGAEWIQRNAGVDTWEYAHETIPLFKPTENFADAWAELAATAGCKYMVFTAKHHDGFGLYGSSVTDYDAVDTVGRDLCKEIIDAARRQELKVGLYYSVIDWHHPQYDYERAGALPHPLKGRPSPNGKRNHDIYIEYLHNQVNEIISNYGTIDIVWWDFSKKGNEGPFWKADELMKMVRKKQPDIISNNRLYDTAAPHESHKLTEFDYSKGDIVTPEQHIPATGMPGLDWETCMTMNRSWGYCSFDNHYKKAEHLVRNLVDIVSKGGNYLLNIAPKGDGSIPEQSITAMKGIGKWMDLHSDAIYGTTASPFNPPGWGRFTKKKDKLFVHVLRWPENGILDMPLPKDKVKKAYVMANKADVKAEPKGTGLRLTLPAKPDIFIPVIALEM
ncbi:MAG: alpha-L-fucosidase [Kiritimatiellae bacterium]|nr:alpha-L-fucosidase [Kiritimatiellia bacterium]